MVVRTNQCGLFNHAEFEFIWFDTHVISADVQWLTQTTESMVANGSRFVAGQLVQLGWMTTMVSMLPNQVLTFLEPDMRTLPITWIRRVDATLKHVRLQRNLLENLGLLEQCSFPSIMHSCLICNRFAMSEDFQLERDYALASDSGWVFKCVESHHDHLSAANFSRTSLYDVARNREDVVQYMAMPAGTIVKSMHGRIEYFLSGVSLPCLKREDN